MADLNAGADLARVAGRLGALPRLDLLVNNAGFGVKGQFASSEYAGQEGMHLLHVMATLRLTHAVLGGMVARRSGAVINVASVAGFLTSPGSVSYGASKSWINTFTEGIWMELRGTGSPVRVQALCPGFTYSEFHDVNRTRRELERRTPAWLWMGADEVAAAGYEAVEANRPIRVTGAPNKAAAAISKIVPDDWMMALISLAARR